MSIIEVYKPSFEAFHEKPTVMWQEQRGPIRVAVNMYVQYINWLTHWTDPSRARYEPCGAFWESFGPQICRALKPLGCAALIFEYETERKVGWRWFTRTPESPISFKTDWFNICHVRAEGNSNTGEARVMVTLPTDEDVSFYFHSSTMKNGWLREKPPEEPKP